MTASGLSQSVYLPQSPPVTTLAGRPAPVSPASARTFSRPGADAAHPAPLAALDAPGHSLLPLGGVLGRRRNDWQPPLDSIESP